MCLEVPSLLFAKSLLFGFARVGAEWEFTAHLNKALAQTSRCWLVQHHVSHPGTAVILFRQQRVFGGSAARLQPCTAVFWYTTAVAKTEGAKAGCPGKRWKHEQSKALEMEEEKLSTC